MYGTNTFWKNSQHLKDNLITYGNLGCKPEGRFTEQHDIFFGIGISLKELIPQMKAFWLEVRDKFTLTLGEKLKGPIIVRSKLCPKTGGKIQLPITFFFTNPGGYKKNKFGKAILWQPIAARNYTKKKHP